MSSTKSAQVVAVSVPVSNPEAAKDFYVDTLGFELLVDNSWREGMRWIEVWFGNPNLFELGKTGQAKTTTKDDGVRRQGYSLDKSDTKRVLRRIATILTHATLLSGISCSMVPISSRAGLSSRHPCTARLWTNFTARRCSAEFHDGH